MNEPNVVEQWMKDAAEQIVGKFEMQPFLVNEIAQIIDAHAAAYVCQPLEVQLSARDAEIAELRANLKRLSSSRASQELEERIKELEGLLEESEDLGNRIAGEVDAMVRKAVAEKDAEIARLKSEANPRE